MRFPFIKYSNFASQIFRVLDKFIPLKLGFLDHKKGFKWKIDGWYSLWTYLTGCEPYTTKIVEGIIAGGTKNFVCVGANRGWYPLIVHQISEETSQYIFEPNPITFLTLQDNLRRNNIKAQVFDSAISDFNGESDLYSYLGINDGASTLFPSDPRNFQSKIVSKVQIKTLDCLFPESFFPVDSNPLLLLDIEGGEFRALCEASNFMKKFKPIIIFEVNSLMLISSGSSVEELFTLLLTLKYEIYWIHEKGYLVKQKSTSVPVHQNELRTQDSTNYIAVTNGYDVNKWSIR
ncbi:MAG: FkbM family methyltransferase [Actinomycetales bacterium]|nr:MAG: FkbM family methyltransferase [Actinomycetales bacterium]